MATKPKTIPTIVAETAPGLSDKDRKRARANMALRPSVNAAAVMVAYTQPLGEQDLAALVDALSGQMREVRSGDMKRAEAMLYGQAQALQAIFMNLARMAVGQEYLNQWEAFLRMGLKAQNQCRMTLETLATIKNPPVMFARQANINNGGQQQVNNGLAKSSRTRENENEQSKLSEGDNELLPDTRASAVAGRVDPQMATVEKVNGAPDPRR